MLAQISESNTMEAHPLVKIAHDPIKGRILVAAKDLIAGQAVVRERPLLVAMSRFEDINRYATGMLLVI